MAAFLQLHYTETVSNLSLIKRFRDSDDTAGASWFRGVMCKNEISYMDQLSLQCSVTILRIEAGDKDENLLYTHPLRLDLARTSSFSLDWWLSAEEMHLFKRAKNGKFLTRGAIEDGMWLLQCAPSPCGRTAGGVKTRCTSERMCR